jgi:hypothetical protein
MKQFNGTGDWKRSYNSGTLLTYPMKEAIKQQKKLRRSDRINNNYIIIVSDGHFDEKADRLRSLIIEAQKEKIKVIWIYVQSICYGEMQEQIKYFDGFAHIQRFTDLSQKLQEIVRKMQLEVLTNLQRGYY